MQKRDQVKQHQSLDGGIREALTGSQDNSGTEEASLVFIHQLVFYLHFN